MTDAATRLMSACHNKTGVIEDIYSSELSSKLDFIRSIAEGCNNALAIARAQEYLRAKFMPIIRGFINGSADDMKAAHIISNLSQYNFRPSEVTFCNSLPLLAKVSAVLSVRSSWISVGKDALIIRQKVNEARAFIEEYENNQVNQDFYYYATKAIIASCDGNFDLAQDHFQTAAEKFWDAQLDPTKHLISDFRGAFNTLRAREALDLMEGNSEDLPIHLTKIASQEVDYINFSAVDVSYFKRFVKHACGSFFDHCKQGSYHIHLVANSSEEAEDAFNSLSEIRSHPNLGLSFSEDKGGKGNNAYYTMVRYFFLKQIRNLYDSPIFVSDVDLVFKSDLRIFSEEFKRRGYHVGVYSKSRLARCIPWFALSATMLYISNDQIGKKFSDSITVVAQEKFKEPNFVKYNMDQNIIYTLMQAFQMQMPSFMRCNLFSLYPSPYAGLDKNLYAIDD